MAEVCVALLRVLTMVACGCVAIVKHKTKDLAAALEERGLQKTATLFVDTEVRCTVLWRSCSVARVFV